MKQLRQLTSVLVISLFIWMPIQAANAATLDDVVKQIKVLQTKVTSVKKSISEAFDTFIDLMYEENPSLGKTIAANKIQPEVNKNATLNSEKLAGEKVKEQLTGASSNFWQQLSELSASDTKKVPQGYGNILSGKKDSDLNYDASMNANTILTPETYTPEQEEMAKYFALFAGDFGDPLPKANLRGLSDSQILNLQNSDPDFRKFLVAKRSFITNRSVGLGNIYQLIASRMPQKGLGEKAGLGNKAISADQLQNYLATRRADNEQWYADMAAASPATIQRENLNVLVEIQKQLQQLHKDNNRILLTLSILQLQGSQMARANMVKYKGSIEGTVKRLRRTDEQGTSSTSQDDAKARALQRQIQENPESAEQSLRDAQ